jgi:hypothetical protein
MTITDLPARPLSPSTLPAFTAPARNKAATKITVTPAVRVTAGPNPVPAAQVEPAPAVPAAVGPRKAPARKRTKKFVLDFLAKELPPRHIATLDAFQLNTALDHMSRLDEHAADLPIIALKRAEHPNELVVAERMTGWHLGSVEEFKTNAEAQFFASPAGSQATFASRAKVRLWAIAFAVTPLITGASTIAVTADGAIGLAVTATTGLLYSVLGRRPERSGVPELVTVDWAHLRRDVVDASLAAVIKERNLPLDAEEEAALTRGFEHLKHIGSVSLLLAGPAIPVKKVRVR